MRRNGIAADRERSPTVATTFAELEDLRPRWDQVAWPRLDGELDYYLAVMQSRREVLQPYGVLLDANDGPRAAAAGRIERISLPTRLGYKTLLDSTVRSLTVALGGTSTPSNDQRDARAVVDVLLAALEQRQADVLWFQSLPVDSQAARALAERPLPLLRQRFVEPRRHHRLELPDSFETFVSSRSRRQRKNIKAVRSKVEGAFGDQLSIEIFEGSDDFGKMVSDVEAIAQKTYQRGLGVGFVDSPAERSLLELSARKGWHVAYVLYRDEVPAAFWTGWRHRRTFFSSTTGYDPAYADLGLGSYLLTRLIGDFCRDPSLDRVDFGPGDAPYKRYFGDESWLDQDVFVFAPSIRGYALSAARTTVGAGNVAARRLLERTGGADRLKRAWRARLRASDDGG